MSRDAEPAMDGRPDAGRGFAWYVKPFLAVGCILVFLTTPIWLPLVPLIARLQAAGERRFLQRMKARGRFKTWEELRPALEAGEGTLIIEQGYKLPARVWWTADDLLSSAPCPPPSDVEIEVLVHVPRPHAFVAWCNRRYTDEDQGTALLTVPDDLPDGYFHAETFRERYPRIRAVDTVYPRDDWHGREDAHRRGGPTTRGEEDGATPRRRDGNPGRDRAT